MTNLPPEIHGPSAWYGPEMLARHDWIEPLSGDEIAEVERATKRLIVARAQITAIRREDFPLPTLGSRLQKVLVHNHTVLHDRTSFEDWPEPERRRHLLRLWLAPANARPLPAVFAERYGRVSPGDRGGVKTPGMKLTAPLDAE